MPAIVIEIDARQFERGMKIIRRWPQRSDMEAMAGFLVDEVQETLLERKRNQETGEQFAPWSKTYREMGAPFHSGHGLLFLTGAMAGSIASDIIGRDELHVGAASPAQHHVHGTPRMPARDFLSLGTTQEDGLMQVAARQLERELAVA